MAGSLSGIKAGRAFVLIEAVDATGKVLNNVRQRLGKFGTELSNIGRTMALRAIAALTPAAFAIKAGASYDDIMRKVEARSEGTAVEMQALRDQTLKLGKTFGLLPSQIGEAQNIFAQAGFNRGEIAQIVPEIAMLARATGDSSNQFENMTQASDAVTAVLRAFHLPAAAAAEVANKIGITATASSFGLEGITTSLSHASSAAATYGVSLDEMLAVMAAMKDIQLDDSIVGTAFRNMMGYMSQTDEQEKFNQKLQELTGNTIEFTDALGDLHGPAKILPALLQATEGLGSAERMNLLFGLLETRAVIPAIAAGSSVERMADLQTRLEDWQGAMDKMQKHMDAGIGGTFRRFTAALEEIAIQFTTALAPSIEVVGTALTNFVKMSADWILKNQGLVATIIATTVGIIGLGTALVVTGQLIIATSAVLGALSLVTGLVAGAFTLLMSALAVIPAALGLSTAGVFALIAAFVALPATLVVVIAAFESVVETVSIFGKHLAADWSKSIKSIGDALTAGDIPAAFNILTSQLTVSWTEFVNLMMDAWDGFLDYWNQTKVALADNSFISEAGAQYAALAEYHTNGGNAQKARKVYDDYKKSFRETISGLSSDAGGNSEARTAKARERQAKLDKIRSDLAWKQLEALLALADTQSKQQDDVPDFDGIANRFQQMMEDANGLIKPSAANRAVPKTGNEAVEKSSVESMKQFIENQYSAYGEKSLEVAEKANEHLANIERKIDNLGMGLV